MSAVDRSDNRARALVREYEDTNDAERLSVDPAMRYVSIRKEYNDARSLDVFRWFVSKRTMEDKVLNLAFCLGNDSSAINANNL